ncbi:LysR substrate-binding domain-containing protein [uncultured Roseibium sp.]|uniref:LysR substrate-binding domain-containing protein n=1 Tax=uncultured Roseibium sp. TaxID=1936171 RepID=UPI0026149927|nr:LysR substrate-binding domain-containing protein [uncultured Roseibium sp.]
MQNLDSELLRTFLAVAHAGSVTDGAEKIHRSQSATSIQIKRLEEILGRPVFERHGRGVVLTETGRKLVLVAQDVTSRLDTVLRDLTDDRIEGKLRLGIPDDHGRARLTRIIADFARLHPAVELDVTCAISAGFPEALNKKDLDLAIYEVSAPGAGEEILAEDPTCWVCARDHDFSRDDVLPVALFDVSCWWRDAAIKSLEDSGKSYRIAYSSQSVSGVVAAVEAGIAIGVLGRSSLHPGLKVVNQAYTLALTPTSKLVMASSDLNDSKPRATMKSTIRAAFLDQNS